MINLSKIYIDGLSLHFIGNKKKDEGYQLSNELLVIDDLLCEILIKYFKTPFKMEEYYSFTHESSLQYNEVYNFVTNIFTHGKLYKESINLAKHLYKCSIHPKIKNGEFYTVYFKNCLVDNEILDAIGLFKSENKDTFLKVSSDNEKIEIKSEKGININKLDKGCLIFNTDKENGYLVTIVDNTTKISGAEAQYWVNDFLQLKRKSDSFFNTQKLLTLCKSFAKEKLSSDISTENNQAEFLNKSLSFIKENSNFHLDEFKKKVFQGTKEKNDFEEFKENYKQQQMIPLPENFEIATSIVKKQSTTFQSIIKLDNNFHIYVHGDTTLIQKGVDENGKKFYRFYYDEER